MINNYNNKVNEHKPPNMAKAATTKKTKAAASALKKAGTKTAGEDVININTPPRRKQRAANQATAYFLTRPSRGIQSTITPRGVKTASTWFSAKVMFHLRGPSR
jgi:hypothetical protein